jgi:hypothetical protein
MDVVRAETIVATKEESVLKINWIIETWRALRIV